MRLIEQAALRLEALGRSSLVMPFRVPEAGRRGTVGTPGDPLALSTEALTAAAPASRTERPIAPPTPSARPIEPRVQTVLDLDGLRRTGHLVSMQERSPLSEEFRRIKRPLLRNIRRRGAEGNNPSLMLVTSALAGEGKTFCAINLAFSIAAEIDTTVLLVDANVLAPSLMTRLGVAADVGLIDLLTTPALQLADAVLATNVTNLMVLPAGSVNGLVTEWFASAAMALRLRELMAGPRPPVVIFDAPGLLASAEAAALAAQMGQVVIVVEAARTPSADVRRAFELVENLPTVMSVLNKGRSPLSAVAGVCGHGGAAGTPTNDVESAMRRAE